MTSIQVAEWLRQGIAAAKNGDVDRASELLLKVVDVDAYNEQAWLWLSSVVALDDDRKVCLENVLAINPDNKLAKAGLVHLRTRPVQPASPSGGLSGAESQPAPATARETIPAPQPDWWDHPQPVQHPASLVDMPERIAPATDALALEAALEQPVLGAKPRRRPLLIRRLATSVLLVLGLLAAAGAVWAFLQTDRFDPDRKSYETAMRPLLVEHDAWWQGPQGALVEQVNDLCGPTAGGWRNRDVLLTCSSHLSQDCSLLAAHCGADVEAMRKQVGRMALEAQREGQTLLAAFNSISAPDEVVVAHSRFLACLQARVEYAERMGRLARGESWAGPDAAPVCQMFPSSEEALLAYVDNQ